MASSGKKKTTMAKLARESRLRERRQTKQAKKDARRNAPPEPDVLDQPVLDGPVLHASFEMDGADGVATQPPALDDEPEHEPVEADVVPALPEST